MYLPHDDIPGLAMSRSLGDYAAHTAGQIRLTAHYTTLDCTLYFVITRQLSTQIYSTEVMIIMVTLYLLRNIASNLLVAL